MNRRSQKAPELHAVPGGALPRPDRRPPDHTPPLQAVSSNPAGLIAGKIPREVLGSLQEVERHIEICLSGEIGSIDDFQRRRLAEAADTLSTAETLLELLQGGSNGNPAREAGSFDLRFMILDVMERQMSAARRHGIQLTCRTGESPAPVRVSRTVVERALCYLVGELIRCGTPGGSLVCQLAMEKSDVDILIRSSAGRDSFRNLGSGGIALISRIMEEAGGRFELSPTDSAIRMTLPLG